MAGGKIEILIDPDTRGFAGKLQGSMAGPLATAGQLGKQLGVLLGVGSLTAAGAAVIKVGNDFQTALNELAGVSQATEQQLAAVSARARELGSDATLIGVSSGDAANAMTELAKGGMSVEQAMSAAHGTLQLAGAAQIQAAEAATIQSAALQAFSLDASEAGRVSDILANAANASSAEIGDVAAAMQQSGTIAHQFGIDIDDTATAIAMFANAGIQGSDAGTMLKSALLALTDQGKPAQQAIEELGLTVYDAQGQFVGLPRLFDDLAAAQKRMTPEAYQAATATLFGSDAMRLAGIAGQQGGEGFRELNDAMNRAGSAAELAEAKTKGLPGALSNVQNQAETAALAVYDLVQGPLTGLANFAADRLEQLPGVLQAAGAAASGMAEDLRPAAAGLADFAGGLGSGVLDAVTAIPPELALATGAMVAFRTSGLSTALDTRAKAAGTALRQFGQDMDVQHRYAQASGTSLTELGAAFQVLENRSPGLRRLGDAYREGARPAAEWAGRQREAADAARTASISSRDLFNSFDRMGASVFHGAADGLGRFASVASGSASVAMSGLKTLAGGLYSAVGGLPGILTGVAAYAFGQWAQSNADAAQKVAQHKADVDTLAGSLDQVTGAITEATRATEAKALADAGAFSAGREYGLSEQTIMNAAMGNAAAQQSVNAAMRDRATTTARAIYQDRDQIDVWRDAGITVADLTDALMLEQGALDKLSAAGIDANWVMRHRSEEQERLTDAIGDSNGRIGEAQAKFDELSRATGQAGLDAQTTAQAMRLMADSVTSIPDSKTVIVDSLSEPAQEELTRLGFTIEQLPDGKGIKVTAPGAMDTMALLDALDIKATSLPGGFIDITDNTPEAIARVNDMGLKVAHRDGRVVITDNSLQVRENVDRNLNGRNTSATHTIYINTVASMVNDAALPAAALPALGQGNNGGILEAYAGGGIRRYALGKLPEQAVIAAPQGARGLVQWAEDETEGEAFIPLAASKRDRSISIWAETGRRLGVLTDQTMGLIAAVSGAADSALVKTLAPGGMASFADGGIMASGLINFARGVEGKPYVWGGVNWGDCSGAVSALANFVSGRDPFGSRFATANEGPELAARGFLSGPGRPGDLRVGWFNGGPGGGHTAATLPNMVNFEMGGGRGNGQYGGSAAGWNLPGGTDWAHFPMAWFADLDKAFRGGALDAALAALGATPGPELAPTDSTIGVDGTYGVGGGTSAATSDRPKTLSGLAGEFGQNLFSELASDALSLLGKSDDLGPLGQAVLALEEANKVEPGSEGAYEKAKLAADRASNRVLDLEEKLRRSRADLDEKRKPKEVRNSKGEVTRTDPPDPEAIRSAEESVAKAERDLETAKRASDLAEDKVRAESTAFGPSALTASGVPTGGGGQPLADGPIPIPGLGNTSEVINYDPAAGTAQWRPLIKIALERTGQAPADAGRTEEQMGIESGGDPKAVNDWDSNAKAGHPSMGLMQVIQPTADAVRAKWPAHFTGLADDLMNPLTNIVAGIDACVNSWGSLAARWPTTEGYATGGKFMAAGTADRVAPSTWRIIGDRPDVDEYYLPDNDDPRTLAFGREWAERRGLQLIRMGDVRRAPAPAPAMAGAPGRGRDLTVVNNGFDRREVVAAADTIRRRDRLATRRQERS
ncbi:MAG: phage tail tape measure protein [Dietzia sp.]